MTPEEIATREAEIRTAVEGLLRRHASEVGHNVSILGVATAARANVGFSATAPWPDEYVTALLSDDSREAMLGALSHEVQEFVRANYEDYFAQITANAARDLDASLDAHLQLADLLRILRMWPALLVSLRAPLGSTFATLAKIAERHVMGLTS